jgi:transcriptional regulator with XRE-family HTH domain
MKMKKKRKPWKQLTTSELLFKLSLRRLAIQAIANRESRGWTAHQLSMRSCVKEKIIRNMENGKQFGVSINVLFLVAKAFGCAIDIKFVSIADQVESLKEEEIAKEPFTTNVISGS